MILSTLTPALGGDTITLGPTFNYGLYVPEKRITVKQTSKGSFTQRSQPLFLDGLKPIIWDYGIITGPEAREIDELYRVDGNFVFTGAYDDSYLIEFSKLDLNRYKTWWKASGEFRVLCTLTDPDICP